MQQIVEHIQKTSLIKLVASKLSNKSPRCISLWVNLLPWFFMIPTCHLIPLQKKKNNNNNVRCRLQFFFLYYKYHTRVTLLISLFSPVQVINGRLLPLTSLSFSQNITLIQEGKQGWVYQVYQQYSE